MNKNIDFDTLWSQRESAGHNSRCPLSRERLESMINTAMTQPPTVGALEPSRRVRPLRTWLAAPLAAAAAVALLLIPSRSHAATPHAVDYDGQQVLFLCNNQCDADGVIGTLDQYLHTL